VKITIITPSFNSSKVILSCIDSVKNQTFKDIEHIIVDGKSTDGTLDIINKYAANKNFYKVIVICERDKGIYDALNKGIKISSGDIIGILHSDDFFAESSTLEKINKKFNENNCDGVYGNIEYVSVDNPNKTIRYWNADSCSPGKFKYGWHPPHTSLFLKRMVFEKYGLYRTDLTIASDYEAMLRYIHKYGIKLAYLPEVLVKMRLGGASNKSIKNLIITTIEDYKAWRLNGLKGGLQAVILKKLRKLPQFFK
jgi:glycosyltransferase